MRRASILGTKISCLTYSSAIKVIEQAIKTKRAEYVCVAAVHLVMECFDNYGLQKQVNKALLVTADGTPLYWTQKLLKCQSVERVYGPELMLRLSALAERQKWSIYFIGGANGQGKKLKSALLSLHPKLKVVGYTDTPVRPIPNLQNRLLIERVNKLKPKLIFVGLGCPLQEQWMIANHQKLKSGVLVAVGAAFDFITHTKKQAPKLLQVLGLEWLFRLTQDPRRLWKRYTITNARFLYHYCLALAKNEIYLE